jgi:hypothetical protein
MTNDILIVALATFDLLIYSWSSESTYFQKNKNQQNRVGSKFSFSIEQCAIGFESKSIVSILSLIESLSLFKT